MVVSGFKFIENKKLMRKIRSTEFKFEKGDGTELTCRITSIKTKDYSIEVSIKVIGSVVHRYRYTNEVRNFCISKNNYFTSAIRKNRFIRQNLRQPIVEYFKLLGLNSWQVELKKVTCKETF